MQRMEELWRRVLDVEERFWPKMEAWAGQGKESAGTPATGRWSNTVDWLCHTRLSCLHIVHGGGPSGTSSSTWGFSSLLTLQKQRLR
jgi:hypothetical protein